MNECLPYHNRCKLDWKTWVAQALSFQWSFAQSENITISIYILDVQYDSLLKI
jgi:hypothetical protein